jgi:hypothetical protein
MKIFSLFCFMVFNATFGEPGGAFEKVLPVRGGEGGEPETGAG